jgi:hypothetical protein
MTPDEILAKARELIKEHGGGDPDKWFYANRYVFARLGVDERKTKTGIKRALLDAGKPCYSCGKPFDTKVDVHLHRLDRERGYSAENCVLMHTDCHRGYHAKHQEETGTSQSAHPSLRTRRPAPEGVLPKESKAYEGYKFLYWWDIAPNLASILDRYEAVDFVKKDTGERCTVPVGTLKKYLTPDRQTTRSAGNWGIRVLKGHEGELAFEPANRRGEWLFLPVTWISEQED